jgi:cell division septum initiation protein DivIVA
MNMGYSRPPTGIEREQIITAAQREIAQTQTAGLEVARANSATLTRIADALERIAERLAGGQGSGLPPEEARLMAAKEAEGFAPLAEVPRECLEGICTYFSHYLAYGAPDLTHPGFHEAEEKCADAHEKWEEAFQRDNALIEDLEARAEAKRAEAARIKESVAADAPYAQAEEAARGAEALLEEARRADGRARDLRARPNPWDAITKQWEQAVRA